MITKVGSAIVLLIIAAFSACSRPDDRSLSSPHEGGLTEVVQNLEVPKGFQVELGYSVPLEEQGSWVSLTPDAKGRLITSDQFGGLYRVTIGGSGSETTVEKLKLPIGNAQGLLYAYDSLYVTVNLFPTATKKGDQGSGFFRLRDTNGDDQFDQVELLKPLRAVENENGHGEHGPHSAVLGPDGLIYLVAGNGTRLPQGSEPSSPHLNWADDLLIRSADAFVPGGWIARTDRSGMSWQLLAGGFRNPYDIAFDSNGELFTFDSDSEVDIGMPWYRPTRINHVVSGGEYGWRYDSGPWRAYGKWPNYYPDSVPSIVDIGFGSPVGVVFGTGTRFPARYQRALFAGDWASGRIYAVHLKPQGASYQANAETFLTGSALPVTDLIVHPDGGLYFTTGGRAAKSGLFRIRYAGDEKTEAVGPIDDPASAQARQQRRRLERFHGQADPRAVEEAWPHLGSSDRALRYAARIAIEHQDPALWRDRALGENNTTASIQALLGLSRVGGARLPQILARLDRLPLEQLPQGQLLEALRVYGVALVRLGVPRGTEKRVIRRLGHLFPSPSQELTRELCRLLVYLQDPTVIGKSLKLLRASRPQEQLFLLATLTQLKKGWTLPQIREFFASLNLVQAEYLREAEALGKSGLNSRFVYMIESFRQASTERLSDRQRAALEQLIEAQPSSLVADQESSRAFVREWTPDDLLPLLAQGERSRSFESGRSAYQGAGCTKCHRFGDQGVDTGPDITTVGNRFDDKYLLEALLTPSQVIADRFINELIEMQNGVLHTGRVVYDDGKLLPIRQDPMTGTLTEIDVSQVKSRTRLDSSEMPEGLLNGLTAEEILDLIAYLRAGGDPDHRIFKALQVDQR